MKRNITKFLAALALLVFIAPSMVAWGQTRTEEVYSTCLFGAVYNPNNSGYTGSFVATNGDFSWTVVNGNNNNNGWTNGSGHGQVKFGRKSYESVGQITTNAAYSEAITKVELTIDALTASKINSIKLYSGISSNSITTVEGEFQKAVGTQTVEIANPAADKFYDIKFDCASGSSNGLITVSMVVYYYDNPSGTPTCAAPTFDPAGGNYYTAQNVTISCTTEGSTIHYTTDGSTPTAESAVYSNPLSISTNTTVKAIAMKDGYDSSEVAEATYNFLTPTFNQDWEGATNGWTFVSVTGDQVWSIASYSGNHYAKMSGYSGSNYANEDWCISPAFSLGDYTNPVLTFTTARSQHDGNDLQVYFSNNYNGDPTTAIWTELTCTLPAKPTSGYTDFTSSGEISLNEFSGTACYIGFKYTSTTSAAATWEVDDIMLESQPTTPTITLSDSSINVGENNPVGEEISTTFTVSQLNLTEGIDLSATIGDLSPNTIEQGAEPTTVTWTYTPTEAGNINATVTATSTGAETQTLTITGAAFAPVTGYSIDFENEASLYTDWIFTNMMSKQTGNGNVNAHGDTYYGTTGGKTTAAVATKTAVATPYLLTCYVTKQSTNTTASTWYIQVSEDGSTWTDVATQDATSMSQGTWVEFTADLSQYTNVYVRVYYSGSTAVRNIDDLTLSTEAPAVAAPTFSPVAGTYNEIQNVTITCATEGATIYYTTDGTTPTDESNEYTEAITVSENTTIKAIAYVGTESSAVATADYVINLPSVATPTFNPAAGTYTEAQNVTIACGTEGASILYKLTENGEWQAYTTALTISETTTVWAKATKTGYNDSEVATATYTIAEPITSGTGTINFGNNGTKINDASVTGTDNLNNTWTITTVGTTSFTQSTDYSQVGSSKNPATSITFTTTLPAEAIVSAFEAKFGGFSGTAGTITLMVGETTVGTGSLDETNDVTVSTLPMVTGTVLTVTVTDIAKGVKCYYISYTLGTESYTLTINGYTNDNAKTGYYLIASPVTVDIANVQGLTDGTFDLYSYDNSQDLEWINYEPASGSTHPFTTLEPGTGYLYAKKATTAGETFSFTLTGTPYNGDGEIGLAAGWNLVGNPFGVAAEISMDYYALTPDATELIATTASTNVAAMQGVFVNNTTGASSVIFMEATGTNNGGEGKLALNVSRNRGNLVDRAIVRFGEGSQLPKFQLFENSTKLYIPQGNQDFAIVRSANEGEMPVSFKASENGTYTLAVETENMEMDYLHLIDNMTGMDVDLLQTPSYTFEASTRDYANRFRLVFKGNSTEEQTTETFAYFNGTSWTVSNQGEATLQVVDVMGRLVSSETINGNATINLNETAGIYMLRLVNGNDVKVQKIVVR